MTVGAGSRCSPNDSLCCISNSMLEHGILSLAHCLSRMFALGFGFNHRRSREKTVFAVCKMPQINSLHEFDLIK